MINLPRLLIILFGFFLFSFSQNFIPDAQKVLGNKVPNVKLITDKGKVVYLSELSNGKPILLSFIYTRCTSVCPIIVDSLKKALKEIKFKDFKVVLIDFDLRDKVENLKRFKNLRKIPEDWIIAIPESEESLRNLTSSVDFKFKYDGKVDMFLHPNVLIVLSSDMKISAYILGVNYDAKKLSSFIKKAKEGKVNVGFMKGLLLKCFRYDPITGNYYIDWSFVAMILGGLIPISLMFYYLFLKEILGYLKQKRSLS